MIKNIYEKPTANIVLSGERLKAFAVNIKNKTRMPTPTTFIKQSIGNLSQSN